MSTQAMPESSMEEIIASISRIIAEDSRASRRTQASREGKSAILELTEALEADGSVRSLTAAEPPAGDAVGEPESAATPPRIEPLRPHADPAAAAKPEDARERIVSAATSDAAAAAFARLGTVLSERRVEPGPPLGAGGRTLEEIVRDALRPLLHAWLDDHLPSIVERLVREEIRRVVGEAGMC
jgi:uncharacterized protein